MDIQSMPMSEADLQGILEDKEDGSNLKEMAAEEEENLEDGSSTRELPSSQLAFRTYEQGENNSEGYFFNFYTQES
jgi:hypothetical protein